MLESPIYKALVTELLPPWGDKKFATMNSHIQKCLKEAGMKVEDSVTTDPKHDVAIIWNTTKELNRGTFVNFAPYLIFDCNNPAETEWCVRRYRILGYELHTEMMKRVKELQWGCKVMEKVQDPLKDFVTVVVPTCDSARYIEDCLVSILGQSHKNLEIILVDDASLDSTQLRAHQLFNKDQRWHSIIPLSKWIPAGAVRQRGIDEAVGNFVCCFDSDDVMPSEYLATALEAFEGENIGFVYPGSWWLIPEENFGKDSNKLQDFTPTILSDIKPIWRGVTDREGSALLFRNSDNWEEASKFGSCMIMPSVYRNSPLFTPRFDPDLVRLQDWDIYLDLRARGVKGKKFTCAPYIRNRRGSITNSGRRVEYEKCCSYIARKYDLPQIPKTLILPLNSNGDPESILAGPRIRGHRIAPHLLNAEIGDLNTLRCRWREFDAFYFVCAPTPVVMGWVSRLGSIDSNAKKILFDICVEYWSDDYEFEGYVKEDFLSCISEIGRFATFVCSSKALAESLKRQFEWVSVEVVEDSIMPSLNIKESYESTGLVSWCGAFGNITSLLAHTTELVKFTEETGAVVRIITDQMPLRLPFRWEWKKWSPETEEQLIIETDIYLLPKLRHSSFNCKGRGKEALACSLGMPISGGGSLGDFFKSEELRIEFGKHNLQIALNEYITPLVIQDFIRILQ